MDVVGGAETDDESVDDNNMTEGQIVTMLCTPPLLGDARECTG